MAESTIGGRGAPCVISVAEHAGWAHLTAIAAPDHLPAVVERRRVTLIDPGLPTQPYHHDSIAMPESDADRLIARVRRSVDACTVVALRETIAALVPAYVVVALAVRASPFPALPDSVAAVRRSYALQCAADGMLYQQAMCRAARSLGLSLYVYRRGGETAWAAERLDTTAADVTSFVSHHGRPAGAPWTAEHRRAYAAGIAALASHYGHSRVIDISVTTR